MTHFNKKTDKNEMFKSVRNVHFVGIGGIGMSGIAEILINQGFSVSGSDLARSENTEYLENKGAKIYYGHSAENIAEAEVVVYSSAVKVADNPETQAARAAGIPLIRRAEMLAEVSRLNYCLAVSGTHGKTTTTSMVGLILIKAGIDPTVIVGGRLRDFGGTNARMGGGEWTVVEADEFDRSFLQLLPTIAILNNIEPEHLDIYKDFDDLKRTFAEFANKVPFYGLVAVGLDDAGVRAVLSEINKSVVTYGLSRHADIRAENITYEENLTRYTVVERATGERAEVAIGIPGLHNVKNSLGAITVARHLGVAWDVIVEALGDFTGVLRRFDIKGERDGVLIVDDYAHHPSEVKSTLSAARNGWPDRRIVCLFQPHTFSRTAHLYEEFGQCFDEADLLIITDVYAAREAPIEGVTGKLISDAATKFGHTNVVYLPDFATLGEEVRKLLQPGDMLLTLGAGNVYQIANQLSGK